MAIQPLQDQLIEQVPSKILGFWALDDAAGVSAPALTYPENQDASVALAQTGTVGYQNAEPFFGAGTTASPVGTSDGFELVMPVGAVACLLLHYPTPAEDQTTFDYWTASTIRQLFGETASTIYGIKMMGTSTWLPPVGYHPVVIQREAYGCKLYVGGQEIDSLNYTGHLNLKNFRGLRISNLMIMDGVGTTVQAISDAWTHAVYPHHKAGVPTATAMSALLGPSLLFGQHVTMPPAPTETRLGRHHVDGSPVSLLTDPTCTKAEVWIQDAVIPATNQTMKVEVNVTTLFDITIDVTTNVIAVNGQSGTVTDYTALKLLFEIDGANNVVVTVRETANNTQLLTTTIALANNATTLSRLDFDAKDFRIGSAFSEGTYPVTPLAGTATNHGRTHPIRDIVGGYTSSKDWDLTLPAGGGQLDGWYSSNRHTNAEFYGIATNITTGEFSLSAEVLNILTAAMSSTLTMAALMSGNTGANITSFKGYVVAAIMGTGAGSDTHPPIIISIDHPGKLYVYKSYGASTPIEVDMPIGVPCHVAVQRDASSNLKVFLNGVEEHTEAGFNDDLNIVAPNSGMSLCKYNKDGGGTTVLARSIALFERSLTLAELVDLHHCVEGTPPDSTYKKVYGKFLGVSSGDMWLIRADSGELIASATIAATSIYSFDNVGYAGDFLLVGSDTAGSVLTSATAKLHGPDVLPAQDPSIPDGTSGTHKIVSGSYLAGVKHKATVYVFRKDTMAIVAKRFVFGGDYEVKFAYSGDVRVVEVVDTLSHHWVETPTAV